VNSTFISKAKMIYDKVITLTDNAIIALTSNQYRVICEYNDNIVMSENFDGYSIKNYEYENTVDYGMIIVQVGLKRGIISAITAETIVPIENIKLFPCSDNVILGQSEKLMCVYNSAGSEIIKSSKYAFIALYTSNKGERIVVAVSQSNQYVIGMSGNILLNNRVIDFRIYNIFGDYIVRTHLPYYSSRQSDYIGDSKYDIYNFDGEAVYELENGYLPSLNKKNPCIVELKTGAIELGAYRYPTYCLGDMSKYIYKEISYGGRVSRHR